MFYPLLVQISMVTVLFRAYDFHSQTDRAIYSSIKENLYTTAIRQRQDSVHDPIVKIVPTSCIRIRVRIRTYGDLLFLPIAIFTVSEPVQVELFLKAVKCQSLLYKIRPTEKGERDSPRAPHSEGPQIVRALFLRIPQNALNVLTPNETLFGARAIT